jgi:hypothetical protein
MRRDRWVTWLAVVVLGAGCQRPEPPPVLSLQGELVSGTTVTPPGAITLAVVWYPRWYRRAPDVPGPAVVTQSATFEGPLPMGFSFRVEGPPPAEALVDLAPRGGEGHAAYGVLVAFRDLNGNGALDLATEGHPSPDRVLGASAGDPSLPPPPSTWFVAYLDGKPTSTDLLAAYRLEQGYNLVRIHAAYGSEAVPADTPISMPLTNTDAQGYYACADADFDYAATAACGIDLYGGKYRLDGILFGSGSSQLRILDGRGARSDGTLVYNGEVVPYDPAPESYQVHSIPGRNTIQVDVPGFPTESITAYIPGPIKMTSPVPATLRSGSAIELSWEADPAVELYDVIIHNERVDDETGYGWLYHELTTGNSIRTSAIRYTGTARVFVMALGPLAVGNNGSYLTPLNRFSAAIDFTP